MPTPPPSVMCQTPMCGNFAVHAFYSPRTCVAIALCRSCVAQLNEHHVPIAPEAPAGSERPERPPRPDAKGVIFTEHHDKCMREAQTALGKAFDGYVLVVMATNANITKEQTETRWAGGRIQAIGLLEQGKHTVINQPPDARDDE